MRNRFGVMGVLLALLLVGGAGAVAGQDEKRSIIAVPGDGVTCTCYWDADCGTGGDCTGYGKCTVSGKLDGTCKTAASEVFVVGEKAGPFEATPEEVAAAVDLYFQSYLAPARAGDGRATASLFNRAGAVWLGTKNAALHRLVQEAVHEALDSTLGFDFVFPQPACFQPSRLGNLRAVPHEGAELIEALRAGFAAAIAERNPAAIEGPLAGFWQHHPEYHPNHAGRMYPHGHAGEVDDPQGSQRAALALIVKRLLDTF